MLKSKPKSYIIDNKKLCLSCYEEIDISNFNINKRTKNGLQPYCKPCQSIKKAEWVKQNNEKVKEYNEKYRNENRDYYKQHRIDNRDYYKEKYAVWANNNPIKVKANSAAVSSRERARENTLDDGSVNMNSIFKVFQQTHCYYCGEFVEDLKRTIDHKIPLSRGGSNTIENIVMSCLNCNCSKHNLTDAEFFIKKTP